MCAALSPYPQLAMWLGFMLAGYSAVANDSIQTIGTFISSNHRYPWYYLWLYIGSLFVVAIVVSWSLYDGDVSYQRLQSKGLTESPTEFSFLQLTSPLMLLVITRLRIPVSTTFMLLTSFSGTLGTVTGMLQKSVSGYFIAFFIALLIWWLLSKPLRWLQRGEASHIWTGFQWITSGTLWYLWIAQDAANVAVFLPRSLSVEQLIFFCAFIFAGLALLFYLRGDKIQNVVDEKSDVTDVRAATMIDLVYAAVLFWFTLVNTVPMSTTWAFIGLFAGREIGMTLSGYHGEVRWKKTFRLIGKDILMVGIGLLVSILLAITVNATIRKDILDLWAEHLSPLLF
ncbi:MAG: hypothetical protein FJ344_02750 [Sphingomonadales bacterium]|nr:hypothetical protein [Sphingomonadales bacterium]